MFRNIIQGQMVTEIYKLNDVDTKRGSVMAKNLATKTAGKADNVVGEVYFLGFNYAPMGHESDLEISDYTDQADIVPKNTYAVLMRLVSGTWGTDQYDDTGLVVGDYLVAGAGGDAGKLVKATVGKVTNMRYIGTYDDAGHTLCAFEIVPTVTVA